MEYRVIEDFEIDGLRGYVGDVFADGDVEPDQPPQWINNGWIEAIGLPQAVIDTEPVEAVEVD